MIDPKVAQFAFEAHAKTNHLYDKGPYSVHLMHVLFYACKYIDLLTFPQTEEIGWTKEDVYHACLLHDVIEDCRVTYNDLKKVTNERVANIVYAVTQEKGKNREERQNEKYYAGIRNTRYATFVKLCDRLANVAYSNITQSRMLEVYRKENDHFIDNLMCDLPDRYLYAPMITEIKTLLQP